MAEAGDIPRFAFVWQPKTSPSGADQQGTLVVWPLDEQRPPGAFARFIVVESEDEQEGAVVAMDLGDPAELDRAEAHPPLAGKSAARATGPAGGQDGLGDLPLLVRLPVADRFTVTARYLVRRKESGRTLVSEVEAPPVRFRRDAAGDQLMLVGLVRGDKSPNPDRPVVVPTVERAIDAATRLIEPSRFIELADIVLDAFESASGGARRRIGSAFVLAVPHQNHSTIGPTQEIYPYSGARVPASTEFLIDEASDEAATNGCPRLSLRVGTSWASQDELGRLIQFFHWNRSAAFSQTRDRRAAAAEALTFYPGELHDDHLSFAFREAAFGDVVGVMTGSPESLAPDFFDWPDHDKYLQSSADWTTVPFVCTGDEMIALNYYRHAETGRVIDAVKHDLDARLEHLPPPRRLKRGDAIVDYLLGSQPATNATFAQLTKQALAGDSSPNVAALDCYGELLRELDRQLRSDGEAGQWRRLESLFAFAVFERAPALLRALVVSRALRQALPSDFENDQMALDDDVLALAMRAVGLSDRSEPRLSRWLEKLDATGICVTWELLRRAPQFVRDIVATSVLPDLELISDWFDDRCEPILLAYFRTPPEQLTAAASASGARGHRADADLLEAAYRHRLSLETGRSPLAYRTISALVELLRVGP
jgi:hypothetical protein